MPPQPVQQVTGSLEPVVLTAIGEEVSKRNPDYAFTDTDKTFEALRISDQSIKLPLLIYVDSYITPPTRVFKRPRKQPTR